MRGSVSSFFSSLSLLLSLLPVLSFSVDFPTFTSVIHVSISLPSSSMSDCRIFTEDSVKSLYSISTLFDADKSPIICVIISELIVESAETFISVTLITLSVTDETFPISFIY